MSPQSAQHDVLPSAQSITATGQAAVDAALAALPGLDSRPSPEHVALYEEVHRRLMDTLAEAAGE